VISLRSPSAASGTSSRRSSANAFRQSLILSVGEFSIFLARAISACLLGCAILLLDIGVVPQLANSSGKE